MIPFRAAVLLLFLACGCATRQPEPPLCALAPGEMPASWRPLSAGHENVSAPAWSAAEAKDAQEAVQKGLDELNEFYTGRPSAIQALGSDAVESLIDASYAASNTPELRTAARESARRILTPLLTPYVAASAGPESCQEFSSVLMLTIHAHALLESDDARLSTMVARTNASYRACDSLQAAMGSDYARVLASPSSSTDELWDLVMWSIMFTDAQTVAGLNLPNEARDLPPALWRYLARYPFAQARDSAQGARNEKFYNTAYLVTHIAYIPTGYDRHPLFVADAPWLFRYLRENFYAVLEMGELDLTAEFVDLFRQYGCNEANDLQTREGTRYLLTLFHSAGNSWLKYREPNEKADTGDYNEAHKAWTGMAALRLRIPEPPAPGTYGEIVRRWLGSPH